MGNIYSSYKNEFEDLELKYNELKVKYESEKNNGKVLNETILNLENEIVKNKIIIDDSIKKEDTITQEFDIIKASYESSLINKENYVEDIKLQMESEINKLNEKLDDKSKLIENYEVKILETNQLYEELRNKYIDLDSSNLLEKKNMKFLENKLNQCEKINTTIKANIIEILNYYYENQDILVGNILHEHNTVIPDYIEKTIIGYIYKYLLDNINENIRGKLEIV